MIESKQKPQAVIQPEHAKRAQPSQHQDASPVVFYEGERIYFRPFELEDEPMLRRFVNNPEVWPFMGRGLPVNGVSERQWIEEHAANESEIHFGIVVREGDVLIGSCGLVRINPVSRNATMGIMIGNPAYHNQGYGSEAVGLILRYGFAERNLNRIGLHVFANNPRAIRTYQKAGFVHEGCLRQAYYGHGKYVDVYIFSVLREEWEATRANE